MPPPIFHQDVLKPPPFSNYEPNKMSVERATQVLEEGYRQKPFEAVMRPVQRYSVCFIKYMVILYIFVTD